MHASSPSQSSRSHLRPISSNDHAGPHKLTPQEAALRGASLAFAKQQQQARDTRAHSSTPGSNDPALLSPQDGGALVAAASASKITRSSTGSISDWQGNRLGRQATGSHNGRISRQTTGNSSTVTDSEMGQSTELGRERQALFPSSPASEHSRGPYLLPPAGKAATTANPKSTSFIAATLAASRSVSPGSSPSLQSGGDDRTTTTGRPRLGEPAHIPRKVKVRGHSPAVSLSTTSSDGLLDTAPLPPTNSLISMFELKRHKTGPAQPRAGESKGRPLRGVIVDDTNENLGVENIEPPRKPAPKTKSKPKVKAKPRDITTPSPVSNRVDTEIVSPRPRRPNPTRRLDCETQAPSDEASEGRNMNRPEERKAKPVPPKPIRFEATQAQDRKSASRPVLDNQIKAEPRPPILPARASSPPARAKPPAPTKRWDKRTLSLAPSTDGQDLSKPGSSEDTADGRPLTAESISSDDIFISASSTPTCAESPPVFDTTSRTMTPMALPPRPASTRPATPAFSLRQHTTGSSQLPIDSLSDAMMAGSLALLASHTPVSMDKSRAPPPVPPSRRRGDTRKAATRNSSPHHLKKTMRDQRPKSDDEDARRPHHKKGLITSKKHTHHEGSRRRWREEITERERKRYEAVWASNRGLFLVPAPHSHQAAVRSHSDEPLSEYVASVAVRDIWSRSRLPQEELAEVWDLVYGQGQGQGQAGVVHAALSKSEFVVGTWLIDQRLRGRKIPPRVSDSVWNSAKGLWSTSLGHHYHKKGKGKVK